MLLIVHFGNQLIDIKYLLARKLKVKYRGHNHSTNGMILGGGGGKTLWYRIAYNKNNNDDDDNDNNNNNNKNIIIVMQTRLSLSWMDKAKSLEPCYNLTTKFYFYEILSNWRWGKEVTCERNHGAHKFYEGQKNLGSIYVRALKYRPIPI